MQVYDHRVQCSKSVPGTLVVPAVDDPNIVLAADDAAAGNLVRCVRGTEHQPLQQGRILSALEHLQDIEAQGLLSSF